MDTIMSFLSFMFQSFWHFVGMMLLLGLVTETVIRLIRGNKK